MTDTDLLNDLADGMREADPSISAETAMARAVAYTERLNEEAKRFTKRAGGSKVVRISNFERGTHGRNAIAARFGR